MSMTVVVTRNVSMRVRGFLASAMLEIVPGVYSSPRMSPTVRDRVWGVLTDWFPNESNASVVMLWQEKSVPGGQSVRTLGCPPITFADVDGLVLAYRP